MIRMTIYISKKPYAQGAKSCPTPDLLFNHNTLEFRVEGF